MLGPRDESCPGPPSQGSQAGKGERVDLGQSGLLTRAVAAEMPGTRRVLTRVNRSEGLREEYLDAEHMKDEQKFTSWRIASD